MPMVMRALSLTELGYFEFLITGKGGGGGDSGEPPIQGKIHSFSFLLSCATGQLLILNPVTIKRGKKEKKTWSPGYKSLQGYSTHFEMYLLKNEQQITSRLALNNHDGNNTENISPRQGISNAIPSAFVKIPTELG